MAMQRVILAFGDSRVEVDTTDDMAQLQCKAEAIFSLQKDSYGFFDACGKVEDGAFTRVFQMAGCGPCRLEVRERMEWQKIRELEARIEALSVRLVPDTTAPACASSMEERIISRVNTVVAEALADMRSVETKIDNVLAPLLESLAIAHMECRARLDSYNFAAFQQTQLDSLEDRVTATVSSLIRKDFVHVSSTPACKLDLASEQSTSPKIQGVHCRTAAPDTADEIWHQATSSPPVTKRMPHSRSWHRTEKSLTRQQHTTGGAAVDGGNALLQRRREGVGKPEKSPPRESRSAKFHDDDDGWSDGMSVSFMRCTGPRHLERKSLSRSVPHLPPVF